MKTKLLFTKKTTNTFYSLLVFCLCLNYGWSQQVIGEFPEMDGGMEAQTATTTMSSAGSGQSGTAQTEWTVSSTSNSEVRSMTNDAAIARTGNFSASWAVKVGSTNVRMQSPSPTLSTIQTETEYTIQFFYKSATEPADVLDPGIYLNNTSGGNTTDKTDITAWAANEWTKTYGTVTTGTLFNASNWAIARISTTGAGGYNDTVHIDDFVVYAGAYDNTAPSAATVGSYSIAGNIGWTAPAGGLDGGGYVVFKYTTMPNADNDPNQNGIYQVGSTTTNGTGSLIGTVAYIGTATTFTDTYVAGTYYKVYAVDKAFNYSDELLISDATLGVAKNEIEGLNIFPNPANDVINIQSASVKIASVEIYSLLGQRVLAQNELKNNQINVASLSRGMYLLKISAEGKSVTKKIIIE